MAGTENLKKSLLVLAKLAKAVDGALEDGKISTVEGVGLAFKALDLIGVVKTLKESREELFDLIDAEIEDIVEAFKAELDLRDDKAEELVEMIIELSLSLVASLDVFQND